MNPILLFLIACILFLVGLGGTPLQTYSHQTVGIITSARSYQRPDGNFVSDIELSYNTNPYTLVHLVPLHTVSKTQYTYGQTVTIYYNPRDSQTVSLSQYQPANRLNLYLVLVAMSIFLLLQKIPDK